MERKDFLYVYAQRLPYTELKIFTETVMNRFLERYQWVEDTSSSCQHCARSRFGFSEEKCVDNVRQGGSCTRETLRSVVMPAVKRMLEGEYPPPSKLFRTVHRKGPIHDGMGNVNLRELIAHYVGGTWQYISANEPDTAQRVVQEAEEDYEKNWKPIFESEES